MAGENDVFHRPLQELLKLKLRKMGRYSSGTARAGAEYSVLCGGSWVNGNDPGECKAKSV